jgi:hypothetical protein
MATSRSSNGAPKKEGLFEAAGAISFVILVLLGLVWFLASHKIVYFSTPGLRWMGVPWLWVNPEKWAAINEGYVFFRNTPRLVPLGNYIAFANDCLRPLSMVITAACSIYLLRRLTSKKGVTDLRRRLDPMRAAKEIAKAFPAIVPVLHLGPDLVADKLPLWRRQTFPEDVWQKERVGGRPLAAGDKIYLDRVETYFRGGEVKDGPHQKRGGKRWSKMLGYQAVDLLADSKKQASVCFPDRFSPQGKVIFALLCAHAFGGRDGKLDYQVACDQLNRSCSGQANGLPNLTVAQWLYNKYRMDPTAKQLFKVHHWEYTYLFSVFIKAKKNGKATHTDFIWLKPLDRVLFYALNTVGRAVPHTEAGSVFALVDYETKCARYGRLPLRMRRDGDLEHNICIYTATEGLGKAFVQYQASTDDNDDWWKNLDTWTAAEKMQKQQASMKAQMRELNAAQQAMSSVPVQPDTPFDVDMNEKRRLADLSETARNLKSGSGIDPDMY